MEKKKLVCFVGKSGSGKTTLVSALELSGYKSVLSMTTREKRFEGETGHVFVSPTGFHKFDSDMVAYTKFDGHEYGATRQMLNEADLYVIDVAGVKELRKRYHDKDLFVVYIDIKPKVAYRRMRQRGDKPIKAIKRIINDKRMFADIDDIKPDLVFDAESPFEYKLKVIQSVLRDN